MYYRHKYFPFKNKLNCQDSNIKRIYTNIPNSRSSWKIRRLDNTHTELDTTEATWQQQQQQQIQNLHSQRATIVWCWISNLYMRYVSFTPWSTTHSLEHQQLHSFMSCLVPVSIQVRQSCLGDSSISLHAYVFGLGSLFISNCILNSLQQWGRRGMF